MVRARKSQARVTLAEGQCCGTPGFDSAVEVFFVLYLKPFFQKHQEAVMFEKFKRAQAESCPSSTTFQTGHFHTHMMQEKAGADKEWGILV